MEGKRRFLACEMPLGFECALGGRNQTNTARNEDCEIMNIWMKRTAVACALVLSLASCSQDAGPNERSGVVLGVIDT